jgi:hypothetical protein
VRPISISFYLTSIEMYTASRFTINSPAAPLREQLVSDTISSQLTPVFLNLKRSYSDTLTATLNSTPYRHALQHAICFESLPLSFLHHARNPSSRGRKMRQLVTRSLRGSNQQKRQNPFIPQSSTQTSHMDQTNARFGIGLRVYSRRQRQ